MAQSTRSVKFVNLHGFAFVVSMAASLLCAAANAQQVLNTAPFVPDYHHHKTGAVTGVGSDSHFSAYAMDNDALDRAATNFSDNSINTTQRLLNHQWLNQGHNNLKVKKSSRALRELARAGAMVLWKNYRGINQSESLTTLKAAQAGSLKRISYVMDVGSDEVELSLSYEF